MRAKSILVGGALVVAIVVQQLFTLPGTSRLAIGLNNSAHGTWFALVLLALLFVVSRVRALRPRTELAIGAIAALVLAPGTELVQALTGRDAGLEDMVFDLVGAVGALAIWAAYRQRIGMRAGAAIAAAAFVVSLYPLGHALTVNHYRDSLAPRVIDFTSSRYRWFVESTSALAQVTAPEAWQHERGKAVLRITFDRDRYPGVMIHEPLPDWTPYRTLVVNAYVPDGAPMPFGVSVRFWQNRDEPAHWPYVLTAGANTLRVPLDRRFDPRRVVSTLVLYTNVSASGRTLYLGDIHLE